MDNKSNYILAYDGDCKICILSVNTIKRFNIIPDDSYIPIQSLEERYISIIDIARAKNEVPLINSSSNMVLYGLDSILTLMTLKWRWIESLSKIKFFKVLLGFLYFLISYNRTIISNKYNYCSSPVCEPNFNLKYRIFYIITAVIISTLLLQIFLNNLPFEFGLNFRNVWIMLMSIMAIHYIVILQFNSLENTFEYLGHLTSVVFKYSFILLILSSIYKIIMPSFFIYFLLILIITLACILELKNRIKSRFDGKTILLSILFYIGFLYSLMYIKY